jgi:hypothetical protein
MNEPTTLVIQERQPRREVAHRAPTTGMSPMDLISVAVQQGADLAKIEKLMDLRDRFEAGEARKAYVAAMAAFKAEPVVILKTKQVNIPGGAKFAHATIADVVDGVVATLSKHGLSHSWEITQKDGQITVTCVLTHEAGHSERRSMTAAPDDSGRKNQIQQVASTVTYLERYTLLAACGLAAKDMDDDARAAGDKQAEANKPQGYDSWKADMQEKAKEGKDALLKAWQASDSKLRAYATVDGSWWADAKATSVKASKELNGEH